MNASFAGPLPGPQGTSTDVLVIGAGPAGLAAAVTAADAGLRVMLLDESPVSGGQYLAAYTAAAGEGPGLFPQSPSLTRPSGGDRLGSSRAERAGQGLLRRMAVAAVDWRPGTLVWCPGRRGGPVFGGAGP